jgi:hypothetical protein
MLNLPAETRLTREGGDRVTAMQEARFIAGVHFSSHANPLRKTTTQNPGVVSGTSPCLTSRQHPQLEARHQVNAGSSTRYIKLPAQDTRAAQTRNNLKPMPCQPRGMVTPSHWVNCVSVRVEPHRPDRLAPAPCPKNSREDGSSKVCWGGGRDTKACHQSSDPCAGSVQTQNVRE